jgi:phosphatidylinositol-3-phosphatase
MNKFDSGRRSRLRDGIRGLIFVLVLGVAVVVPLKASAPTARAASSPVCGSTRGVIKHVVWVVFENRSYSQVLGHAPYIDSLVAHCGQATNMHNISHPSLPNYIALTSGLSVSQLPHSDCLPKACPVKAPSIFSQSRSWAVYAESMPTNCLRANSGAYRAHHTAAPYYPLPSCATNDRPLTALNPSQLPAFTMIVPNVLNDMHENTSSVAAGDAWLSKHLPALLSSPAYTAGQVAIFVTWDEGGFPRVSNQCATNTTDQGCHILTVVLSHGLRHTTVNTLFTHYSLLRTTEELLGYPLLGLAAKATSMRSAFGL